MIPHMTEAARVIVEDIEYLHGEYECLPVADVINVNVIKVNKFKNFVFGYCN